MDDRKKHVSKKNKSKPKKKSSLDIDEIKDLGGDESDLKLLEGVDSDDLEEYQGDSELGADDEENLAVMMKKFVAKMDFKSAKKNLGTLKENEEDEIKVTDAKGKEPKTKDKSNQKDTESASTAPPGETKKEKKKRLRKERREAEKKKKEIQDSEVSSSSEKVNIKLDQVERKHMLLKPDANWFDQEFPQEDSSISKVHPAVISKYREYISEVYKVEAAKAKKQRAKLKKSNANWMETVIKSGTLSDKLAALSLEIQDDPIHTLEYIDSLLNMAQKKNRRESSMALDSLQNVFISDLLPEKRKLRTFEQHPFSELPSKGNTDVRDRKLIMWYFESELKDKYASFLRCIERLATDTVEATKKQAVATIYFLLNSKPEQEKKLLSLLVNKLGDPILRVASNSAHHLTKLVTAHPGMRLVVVKEIETLLYRPNIAAKAQYYAMCFLNQMILSHDEPELVEKLINIYFSFFKLLVKKEEADSKMMSALLAGVNRAFPFAETAKTTLGEQLDTLYKAVNMVNFNTSLQALMLLYQTLDSSDARSDRYYVALYKKILDPELKNSSKQSYLLNLLFKSLRKDEAEKRTLAFVKRLLQISAYQPAPLVCGVLILISELSKKRPQLLKNLTLIEEDSDDDEEHFQDVKVEDEETTRSSDDEGEGSDEEDDESEKEEKESSAFTKKKGTSWIHRQNAKVGNRERDYDPVHWDPLHCGAEGACITELVKLSHHFHPTVALYAQTILKGEHITSSGDPLQDYTLAKFLERFVFKNPKKAKEDVTFFGKKKAASQTGARAVAINSETYREMDETDIPVEERFFHNYFKSKIPKKVKAKDSELTSEEIDDFLDDFLDNEDAQDDLDFLGDLDRKAKAVDGDDSEDEFDDDDMSDALSGSSEEGDPALFDEEAVEFSDEDELPAGLQGKKRKAPTVEEAKGKKKKKFNEAKINMAAEELGDMIDDNEMSELTGTSDDVAFSGKKGAKQLAWEMKRFKKQKEKDIVRRKKQQKGKSGGGKGKKPFKKRR